MSPRLTEYVKHTDLGLPHHLAFWNRVEALLPLDALADGGELRSMWLAAPAAKPGVNLEPGLKLIREFEDCRLTSYPDPGTGGEPWTVGWGSTRYPNGTPVRKGDKITQAAADLALGLTVEREIVPTLAKTIPYWGEMSTNQQCALISFAWNLGWHFCGHPDFKTITAALRDKRWNDVPAAMMLYCNPNSSVEAGLRRRREAEGNLWSSGKTAAPEREHPAKVKPSDPFSTKLTPHITLGEFALGDPARRFVAQHQIDTAAELAAFLERVRRQFGGKRITITSGHRPPAINRLANGASSSEHLFSQPGEGACDFYVDGGDMMAVQSWCDKEWPFSLGYAAPRFIHLGRRADGQRRRWDYH